jgi:pimeloyl-ACP methyl ester carboxylesterase
MYYEIHGEGAPVVLLHGGLATIELPGGELLASLAQTRQVIAIESQGHGRTADIDRPITYENMAEDVAALIQYLELGQPDVIGFSMGGTTALGLAARHPDLVRNLVVISGNFNNEGLRIENLEGTRNLSPEALAGTPIEAAYMEVAPNPDDWPVLLEKIGQMSLAFEGWTPEELGGITAPTMTIIGDSDAVHLDHAVELFRLVGGDVNGDFAGIPASGLTILPQTTHFTILTRLDLLMPIIVPFLDAVRNEGA